MTTNLRKARRAADEVTRRAAVIDTINKIEDKTGNRFPREQRATLIELLENLIELLEKKQ